jgi:hypothetical protein
MALKVFVATNCLRNMGNFAEVILYNKKVTILQIISSSVAFISISNEVVERGV